MHYLYTILSQTYHQEEKLYNPNKPPLVALTEDMHRNLRIKSAIENTPIRKIVEGAIQEYFKNNPVPVLESKSA